MNPSLEIAITNRVLNCIQTRCWKDYDNFSSKLSCHIIKKEPRSSNELATVIKSFGSPFYTLNNITPDILFEVLPTQDVLDLLSKYHQVGPLTFRDIFPETLLVGIDEGKRSVINLTSLPESKIQETLVDSLREKNATNCRGRGKDTALEVSDLEDFALSVKGVSWRFSGVVKGFKSVGRRKSIPLEKIAHQVMKAYNRTAPDYVLLVMAMNPADSVTSELVQYSKSVGNPNLVVMCDPVELARFLKARHVLQ